MIILHFERFLFTPALAGGLSLKPEWQQVTAGLQESTENSSQSRRYSLDGSNPPVFSIFCKPLQE